MSDYDDDDDDGPGFFTMLLVLGGAAGGGWFLWRTLSAQAAAATTLPASSPPALIPSTPLTSSSSTSNTAAAGASSASASAAASSLPVGIRNNNPGNIKWSAANNWDGQIGQDSQGFVIFSSMLYGIRAMFVLLQSYDASISAMSDLGAVFDILSISARWTADNQTAWMNAVTSVSGIGSTTPLDSTNQTQMSAVVNGIIAAENGAQYIGTYASLYPTAWSMMSA